MSEFEVQSGKHMLVLSSSEFGTFETCRRTLNMSFIGVDRK
jgi:hypothetical protein